MFKYHELIKNFRMTILGLTLIFILPTPSSGKSNLIDAAKKEKKLTIYTTTNLVVTNTLVNSFKEKYPFLKVGIYRTGTQKFLTKSLGEARAGKYIPDLYLTKVVNLSILRDNNLLMKYISPESKNYQEELNESQGFWIGSFLRSRVVAYNTRLVSKQEAPNSYEDLLDPKWKGKIGMPMEKYVWFGIQLKIRGEENGLEFFKNLAAQNLIFYRGLSLCAQLLAAGEFSVLGIIGGHSIEQLKDQGAPVEWFYAEPIVHIISGSAIAANASHPNAAKLFTDFILSREGQMLLRSFHYVTNHADVDPEPPRMSVKGKLYDFETPVYEKLVHYTKLYKSIFDK
jgi:iron(III) transport system substrate-binding protein